MSLQYFISYFFIVFIATITPGPSMLLAINHGVNHGISKTIYSGLGNLIGNLLMALISLLGLGAILLASSIIFNIIKWIGIIYLVFIGIKIILAPVSAENTSEIKTGTQKNINRLFLDGFIIAIGNPKGILFFTALFPQFININSASLTSFTIIFATLGVIAFGCYMLYALFGVKLSGLLQLQSFRKLFNKITGSVFIGTGLALAFAKK